MSEIYIIYTTIIHAARIKLGITVNEYCVADSIHKLSHNPRNPTSWCYASKKTLADALGLTERTAFAIVSRLIQKKIIEQNPDTHHLKTTDLWYDTVEAYKEEEASWGMKKLHAPRRNFIDHEETSYSMKKLHEESSYHHEETLPDHEESSYNKDKDNNKDNNISKDITDKSVKVSFGKPEINELIEALKEKLNLTSLDGTVQENRNYAQHCLNKFGLEQTKQIMDAAVESEFWSDKVTSLKTVYYKGNLILKSHEKKEDKIYADLKTDY